MFIENMLLTKHGSSLRADEIYMNMTFQRKIITHSNMLFPIDISTQCTLHQLINEFIIKPFLIKNVCF